MNLFVNLREQCRLINHKYGPGRTLMLAETTCERLKGDILAMVGVDGNARGWTWEHALSDEQKKIPGVMGACEGVLIIIERRAPTLQSYGDADSYTLTAGYMKTGGKILPIPKFMKKWWKERKKK